MPTASIKAEKEKQPPADASDPLRQGITIVEHKIRNLEKRKARLDSYRVLQSSGKELQPDQINAVQKYDEVIQTLDFARDLCKQLNTLSVESAKAVKKQLWKEAQERTKEILIIQDVLSNMGQDNVREDLTNGRASISLTAEELAQIDELYQELTPKVEEPPQPYMNQFQNCAEVMASLVEGKTKKAFGTTYSALKEKLLAIAASGYFDPVQPEAPAQPAAAPPAPQPEEEPVTESIPEPTPPPPQPTPPAPVAYTPNAAPPAAAPVPVMPEVSQVESALFQQQQYQQQQQQQFQQQQPQQFSQQQPIPSQQQQQQQQQQNLANLVFKSGSINFIQENEVDEPLVDSSIPSQTFTNQNYVPSKGQAQQAPPPPAGGDAPGEYQDDGWTPVGGEWNDRKDGMMQADDDGNEWQETNYHNNQSNDGFTPAGGGRGGRGRGGRGGRGNRGQPRPNSSNRGGYNRDGGYNREGGYNRGGGDYRGGEHKEGGYQNGVRERRGGRGGGGGPDSRGRGRGGGGPRPPRRAGHQ